MRTWITLIIILFSFTVVGCSESPSESVINTAIAQTEIAQLPLTQSAVPPSPTSTLTFTPTSTPLPTNTFTPQPTFTRRPTNTRVPTATPTPEPLIFTGSGDSIIDVAWDGAGLLHIAYSGGSNFVVINYDSNGDRIDLLVNTIGNYNGTIPLDFMDYEDTTRISIESSGDWTIQVLPLGMVRQVTIPGTFTGTGDEVVFLVGADPDILAIDASGADRNFLIWTYGGGRDLVVNEIAPYTGTVIVSRDTMLLVIGATGDWSIEVRTP